MNAARVVKCEPQKISLVLIAVKVPIKMLNGLIGETKWKNYFYLLYFSFK